MGGAAVGCDRLQRPVRDREDGAAGRLVDAAALHADEAVLDEVEAADAVVAAQLVEVGEQRGRRQRLAVDPHGIAVFRSEEHTSELQSLMRISYAVFCLKKENK